MPSPRKIIAPLMIWAAKSWTWARPSNFPTSMLAWLTLFFERPQGPDFESR